MCISSFHVGEKYTHLVPTNYHLVRSRISNLFHPLDLNAALRRTEVHHEKGNTVKSEARQQVKVYSVPVPNNEEKYQRCECNVAEKKQSVTRSANCTLRRGENSQHKNETKEAGEISPKVVTGSFAALQSTATRRTKTGLLVQGGPRAETASRGKKQAEDATREETV